MKRLQILTQPNINDQTIGEISSYLGISEETARILYSRSFDTPEKAFEFLHPSSRFFYDPFDLDGMKPLIDRLHAARDNGETVLVYGDYDADGISATAILYSALTDFGINAEYVIPERKDGYGLSLEVLERAADEWGEIGMPYPDLIITVDCGVSDSDIIEEIKNLGIEVIVTDHHEIPDVLPDCIVVNPKKKNQKYPFDGLCGGAVAYKTAVALIGKAAEKYLDIAALATVADSMPLTDENRLLVTEGLKIFNSGKIRKQYAAILSSNANKQITASTLAYTIAPKINAAGRMGSAATALKMFMTEDDKEIFDYAVKLSVFNTERQAECEKLYLQVKDKIKKEGAYSGAMVVAGEDWHNGLLGITAAKIAEEYARPTIIFAKTESGFYKGSARSVEGVNIYEAISKFKDLLVEFGGHSQAAGVCVSEQNYPEFKRKFSNYILENYPIESFDTVVTADIILDKPITLDFAKELEMFEPCGTGNRKPMIATYVYQTETYLLKAGSNHLSFKTKAGDMLWFNGESGAEQLTAPVKKAVVFEPNISVFNGKESLKGFVRDIVLSTENGEDVTLNGELYGNVLTLEYGKFSYFEKPVFTDFGGFERYGVVFICYDIKTLEKYPTLSNLKKDFFRPSDGNLRSRVVISPYEFEPLEDYKTFVFLDTPLGDYPVCYGKEIYITEEARENKNNKKITLDLSRESMGVCFNKIKEITGRVIKDAFSAYYACGKPKDMATFTVAFKTFCQLGFFYNDGGVLRQNPNIRASLDSSEFFKEVKRCYDDRGL